MQGKKQEDQSERDLCERWLAAIAHQLKNPIQGMDNALFLLEDTQLNASAHTYLTTAKEEIAHMKQLVTGLLDRYRPKPIQAADARLSEVLDSALAFYAHKIAFKKVDVVKHYSNPGFTSAMPGDMRQVFRNLIVNALEALPQEGGRLLIRVSRLRSWKRAGSADRIRVTIADNGSGITSHNLRRIFSGKFTTKGAKGNGVGLWIAKRLVEDLGGSIRVRSSVKPRRSWTCFTIFLPVTDTQSGYLGTPQAA